MGNPLSAAPKIRRPAFQGAPQRINELQAFTPAVMSDTQFAEVKQLTVEQFASLEERIYAMQLMMLPIATNAQQQLGKYIKENVPNDARNAEERNRLMGIATMKLPEIAE